MAIDEKQPILLKFIAVPFKEQKTKQTSNGFSQKIADMLLKAIVDAGYGRSERFTTREVPLSNL